MKEVAMQPTKISPKAMYWAIGGAALGAAATYFFDPVRGHRRRIVLHDKFFSKMNSLKNDSKIFFKNLKSKIFGSVAQVQSKLHPKEQSDETLNQRVRSTFGRQIRHAKAIQTSVTYGIVTLSGPILADEVDKLIKCVKAIPGVQEVVNHLDIYKNAQNISALQGAGPEYLK